MDSGRSVSTTREAFSSRTRRRRIRSLTSPRKPTWTDPSPSSSAAATEKSPTAFRRRPAGTIWCASTVLGRKYSKVGGHSRSRRRFRKGGELHDRAKRVHPADEGG